MKIIDSPQHHPGCCLACRCTPAGPFLDFETEVEEEWLYLCMSCVGEVRRVLNEHADKQEPQPTAEGHECPECGKVCKNAFALQGHMRSHAA